LILELFVFFPRGLKVVGASKISRNSVSSSSPVRSFRSGQEGNRGAFAFKLQRRAICHCFLLNPAGIS
jgi:hypothetical protein